MTCTLFECILKKWDSFDPQTLKTDSFERLDLKINTYTERKMRYHLDEIRHAILISWSPEGCFKSDPTGSPSSWARRMFLPLPRLKGSF
jgi:hypothetical protein